MTPAMFASLSRLEHLSELKLADFYFDLGKLGQAQLLEPLLAVRKVTIEHIYIVTMPNGQDVVVDEEEAFARVFTVLFPNAAKTFRFLQVRERGPILK